MKIICPLVITFALAIPLSAQWYDPLSRNFFLWGPFFPNEPSGIEADGCTISPRNFSPDARWRDPLVDEREWNKECILESHVNNMQIANVKRWDKFSAARVAHAFQPTMARLVSDFIGPRSVNPRDLSTLEQAERYGKRMVKLAQAGGIPCSLEIFEQSRDVFGGRYDYGSETRRVYLIERSGNDVHARDGSLVAGWLYAYMNGPEEAADARMTTAARTLCAVPRDQPKPQRRQISGAGGHVFRSRLVDYVASWNRPAQWDRPTLIRY